MQRIGTWKTGVLLALLTASWSAQRLSAASVTIGTYSNVSNNGFPYNDPNFDGGLQRYQEHYAANAFGGLSEIDITSFSVFSIANFVGDSMTPATFDIYMSYAANTIGNDSATFDNNVGSDRVLFDEFTNPATQPSVMTITGNSGFDYNPSMGDLLIDIVPVTFGTCPGTCGGFESDGNSGAAVERNWQTPQVGSQINDRSALVTQFTYTAVATPEPATLATFGTAVLLMWLRFASLRRRINLPD